MAKKESLDARQDFSLNDHRYWLSRVYLPTYSREGEARESGIFSVRIQAHGERRGVSLGQTQKREAAKAALRLYGLVKAQGWERGLAEFRGTLPSMRSGLTLGDYLNQVAATGLVTPRTFRAYICKFRPCSRRHRPSPVAQGANNHGHVHGGA